MHATPKITKRVRDLVAEFYDDEGYLRKSQLGQLREGCYRAVIIRDGVAFKFARYEEYAGHNRTEWEFYKNASPSVRALLAKPLAISSCGRVMAVELVPNTVARSDDHTPDDGYNFNDRLRELLAAEGYGRDAIAVLLSDNHNNNIGVRENGDLCWIDYATCWGDDY